MATMGYSRIKESLLVEAERFEEVGDYKMAARVLLRGAKMGNDSCQLNLGNYYASGTGVRKNLDAAGHWYKNAYRNGNSWGAFNLAIDKRDAGNRRSAETWFKKAVALRHGGAYIQLAKMYIAENKKKSVAADMLRRAIKMGTDDVSTDERVEAKSLLRKLGGWPVYNREKLVTRMSRKRPKSSSRVSKTRRNGIRGRR